MNIATQPVPRPGRPKSQAKREAIREAAGNLFLSTGFQGTSMDAVAAAAGVSKQTVYSHFASKSALFRACVAGKVSDYGLDAAGLAKGLPLRDALIGFGAKLLSLLCDPQVLAMYRLMISECTAHNELVENFFDAGPAATCDSLARYLMERQTAGELAFDDPKEAAHLLVTLIKHRYIMELLLGIRSDIPPAERRAHVEASVEQFLKLTAA